MEYSPISYMKIRNFRNIADATIEFNESPIVTLIGENEAGKTSVIKAFCVAGLNAFSKKQKNYIREGTNGFGIEIGLADGSIVQRIKTNASNQLNIKDAEGKVSCANKIDAGSIPVELQKVMGLIEEPETKEYLQVRTYEDQLLFVITPGSTNYKVMYDSLKVEQLTKALKVGSEQALTLKRTIDEAHTISKALMDNIRQIRITDIEPVVNIKNRLKTQLNKLEKLQRAVELKNKVKSIEEQLGFIKLINDNHLSEIDMTFAGILCNVYNLRQNNDRMIKELKGYDKLSTISEIDTTILEKLKDSLRRKIENSKIEGSLGIANEVGQLKEVDIASVIKLKELISVYSRGLAYKKYESMYDTKNANEISDASLNKINKLVQAIVFKSNALEYYSKLQEFESKAKEANNALIESGAIVADCPNCGETVVMSTDALYNT